jgi:hypothetical protein
MKISRSLVVVGVLVAGLAAFTIYDSKRVEKQEEKKSEDSRLFRLKPDDIQKIEISGKKGAFVLERKDKKWSLISPIQDSADDTMVLSIINSLEGEKSISTVIDGGDLTLSRFGLDKPEFIFKVTGTGGKTEEVKIGSERAYNLSLYVQLNNEPRVLMASSNWEAQLNKNLVDLRDKRPYRAKLEGDVTHLEIKNKDQTLIFDKNEKGWKQTSPAAPPEPPIASAVVDGYIEQVKALRGLDIRAEDKDAKGESAKQGLLNPGLEITLANKKSEKYVLKAAAPATGKANELNPPNVPVVGSDAPQVYGVVASAIDPLRKKADDFLDRKFAFQFKPEDVGRIKIEASGAMSVKAEFVKKGEKWELLPSDDKGALQKEPDSGKLNELAARVSALEAVRFLETDKAQPKSSSESRIELLKGSGEKVFEMSWGSPIMEKVVGPKMQMQAQATFVPVQTSLLKRKIGVPEASIRALGIDQIFQTPLKTRLKDNAPSPPKGG